jgi:NTE family protein
MPSRGALYLGRMDQSAHFRTTTMRCAPEFGTKGTGPGGAERPVGQVVLVLQGGGALGAYQAGVYQALSEGGVEPNWIIGTSIGAVNGAIIAGNEPGMRASRLKEFWSRISDTSLIDAAGISDALGASLSGLRAVTRGVRGLFKPRFDAAAFNVFLPVGIERAAFYSADPLRETLRGLVNFDAIDPKRLRLTVGAVNASSGQMQYFDSRRMKLDVEHVIASSALPPGFAAVKIDGEYFWDGSIYSNTPIEVVFDDNPRRDSLIFAVNVWHADGPQAKSIWQVLGREQDIQFASREDSHIARQEQLHQLRHVVRELVKRIPKEQRNDPEVRELAAFGCTTTMHVVRLFAPRLENEDFTKALDFTPASIKVRWEAGYAHAQQMLQEKPWHNELGPLQSAVLHDG